MCDDMTDNKILISVFCDAFLGTTENTVEYCLEMYILTNQKGISPWMAYIYIALPMKYNVQNLSRFVCQQVILKFKIQSVCSVKLPDSCGVGMSSISKAGLLSQ